MLFCTGFLIIRKKRHFCRRPLQVARMRVAVCMLAKQTGCRYRSRVRRAAGAAAYANASFVIESVARVNAVGLLDELQQQAQQRKASEQDAEQRKAEREDIYRTRLEPGMQALHEYLQKLVDNLKVLQPKKRLCYMLAGYGEIVGYVEHDYDLKFEQQPSSRKISLRFPCIVAQSECPAIQVHGSGKVRAVSSAFQRQHLGGLQDQRKNANGEITSATFQARGKIILSATFSADVDSALVKMNFVNIDSLVSVSKNVRPEQVDEKLFDEIGRYLTQEPSNLFRETLPDAYRMQLRTRVEQDQVKRRWETRISDRQETELEQLRREHSLGGRLSGLLPGAAVNPKALLGKLKGLVKK